MTSYPDISERQSQNQPMDFKQISIIYGFVTFILSQEQGRHSLIIVDIFHWKFEARVDKVTNIRWENNKFVKILFVVYFIKSMIHANRTLIKSKDSPPSLEAKLAQWEPTHGTCRVTPPSEIFVPNYQLLCCLPIKAPNSPKRQYSISVVRLITNFYNVVLSFIYIKTLKSESNNLNSQGKILNSESLK